MERLTAPSDFIRTKQTDVSRTSTPALLTPSHFTVTCNTTTSTTPTPVLPPAPTPALPPAPAPSLLPLGAEPWTLLTQNQQEMIKLRQENRRLLQLQSRNTDTHLIHTSGPSHTLYTTHTVLNEEWDELRRDVQRLRQELRERDSTITRQCADHEKLCTELQQTKQKVLELQKECELQCEQMERERQKSEAFTQQLQRDRQQKMEELCERHRVELSTLTQTNSDLQDTVHTLTQEVTSLGSCVEKVTAERDTLRAQLSAVSSQMEEQTETLQKLRSYIGTKDGDEEHLAHIQKLQKENDALCLSVELLNVRLKSVTDILALQEKELVEQCDPLQQDRSTRLLTVWREKVFMLLLQLRSRDSQLHTEKTQLHNMVDDLQQEVQKLQSHTDLLQHNLQDKTAQLQLHNIHTQELQQQLCTVVEENKKLEQYKELTDKSLAHMTNNIHRMCIKQWEDKTEAVQSQMRALIHRITFANTRLDTVHGLLLRREALWKVQQATKPPEPSEGCIDRLQSQVVLLSSERDTLAQELKRTPELINNALRDLQLQLDKSAEELKACKLRCLEAQTHTMEQERTIVELRAEAHHTQNVLQEKLSEVEGVCAKQLREMEAQLNTTRREHTKAVVALRQVERAAEREREQEREAERARSEHTLIQTTQLHTQLKEKDRDYNILLAVVQQQGLMNEYKKMRRAALRTSKVLPDQQPKPQHHHEGSVLSVLGELCSLSSAVIHSSEEEEEEDAHRDKEVSSSYNNK